MLVLVAATQGAVVAVRSKYEPRTIRAPRLPLGDLPAQLDDWSVSPDAAGESGISEELFAAIGAQDAVTREYKHPDGWTCSVHLATWHESDEWMPHPPDTCYKGAGYHRRNANGISLPRHAQARVCESRYDIPESGLTATALYWYQMGEQTYYNRSGARPVRQSFWGNSERPPLVKVLMQSTDPETDDRNRRMQGLADAVFDFVAGL